MTTPDESLNDDEMDTTAGGTDAVPAGDADGTDGAAGDADGTDGDSTDSTDGDSTDADGTDGGSGDADGTDGLTPPTAPTVAAASK